MTDAPTIADVPVLRRGLMLVLSSPSGAGKTTLSRLLLEHDPEIELSISATTRPKRPAERDGVDYRFVDHAAFRAMIDRDELLEYAQVFENYYGTPRGPVEKTLSSGRDMLFDIDWQGAQQLREKIRGDIVSVFILPPSMSELKARLQRRAEDSAATIATRLANARNEIEHWREYDYVVVNRDLDRAFAEVRAIVAAERLRRDRNPGLFEFVSGLLDEKVE